MTFFFSHGSTALVGLGLPCEDPRSHSETQRSVGLLWKSDRSVAEISYLTTQNTHGRQTYMPPAVFEPAVPAIERP